VGRGVDLNDLPISKKEVSRPVDNTIVVSGPVIDLKKMICELMLKGYKVT